MKGSTVALTAIGASVVGAAAAYRYDDAQHWGKTLAGLVFVGFGLGVANIFVQKPALTYATLALAAGGVGVAAVGLAKGDV